jgi:hypothetical protein
LLFVALILLVFKIQLSNGGKDLGIVIHYSALNKVITKEYFLLPLPEELIDKL